MTEELAAILARVTCPICNGTGTLHTRVCRFRPPGIPEYVETHRPCFRCDGTGTRNTGAA